MKKAFLLLVSICLLAALTGCTSFKAYTYNVNTGDQIELRLDTSDKYNISSDLPFTISRDGETLSQGSFITAEGYDEIVQAVMSDSNAEVIEEETRNGVEYIFYAYNESAHTEYNYVVKIVGSNTGLLLANIVSQDSAEEYFNRLTIRKK